MLLLREKLFLHTLELSFNALDLLPRGVTLRSIEFGCLRAGDPPLGTVHNRAHQFQIADQFSGWPGGNFLLPLRFEKQRGIIENALSDSGRSPMPGAIQLARCARIAVILDEDARHEQDHPI